MKTILDYLDNMFKSLPLTKEVMRAKEELAAMMEDKYNELIAEGKKENEAVGIVISEFGNLQELSAELGLEEIMQSQRTKSTAKMVSREEAYEYLELSEKTAKGIAIGAMLCIYSPIILIFLTALQEYKGMMTESFAVSIGLSVLLLMVAVAVSLFIINGMRMEKFEYLKKETFVIDSFLEKELKTQEDEKRFGTTVLLIIGVTTCIVGVIPLLVVGTVFENNEFLQILTLILLLLLVGSAVYLLITAGNGQERFKVLRQQGDFSEQGKRKGKLIDKVAGPYWMLIVLIYLGWSFITMQWGITWIIWPIAGVLFALIAAIVNSITENNRQHI